MPSLCQPLLGAHTASCVRLTLAARVAERWLYIRLVLTSGRCGLSTYEVPDHGQFVQKFYRQSELMSAITHAA